MSHDADDRNDTRSAATPPPPAGDPPAQRHKHRVVIAGGGTAGITVAARLTRGWSGESDVAIVEPSEYHYYQPAWTLVGGGAYPLEATRRREADVIPRKATWIRDAVAAFDPQANRLRTASGAVIEYDFLVVALGIKIRWDAIPGLVENLGRNGVCSNYSYQTAAYTWECIRNFSGGTAVFTQPVGAIKCGGAPQKICYLAEDWFRRRGIRDRCRVIFATAGKHIFGIEKYRPVLEHIVRTRGIETLFRHNLVELDGEARTAIFENLDSGERVPLKFDMIHVTPPQGPPDVVAASPLADADGWVDVDPYTLQHKRFANVFGIGDCTNLPTSKTGAAVRKQAPVLVANLRAVMQGREPVARYDGYTSCPLVTRLGRVVLAEFDYDKKPAETFPFDQARERWSMWLLKKYLLPRLYWYGMLKGLA